TTARKRFEGIDNDAGWYNLGNTLAREGNYDEAIAAYDRALALHPSAWPRGSRLTATATSPLHANASKASTTMPVGTTWATRWHAKAITTKR
ncbi:hypothetical protein C7E12_20525, partial [Stenotrophomonas maltophilia]